jgi:hypothetical protein
VKNAVTEFLVAEAQRTLLLSELGTRIDPKKNG